MRMTKWNNLEKEKKRSLIKHKRQQEMFFKRQLERQKYQYPVTPEVYSSVKCQMHELGLTRDLPGRDAYKEVLTFMKTFNLKQHRYYILALNSAKQKVKGRRFIDENGNKCVITTLSDVEQVMRESLRAAGIYKISVRDFIYSQLQ